MNNKEVKELFSKRHSIRKYSSKPVDLKDIETIKECGLLAPCGLNRHLSHLYTFFKGEKNYETLVKRMREKSLRDNPFYDAPVIIIEAVEKGACTPLQDGSAVIENMLLAAAFLDLGACWINAPYNVYNDEPELLEEIGIPTDYMICGSISLGHKEN